MDKAAGRKMLVVDDDNAFRELLKYFFEKKGWVVLTAQDAEEGIRSYRKHHPAAVILDVNLESGRDGISLCNQIRDDISSDRTVILLLSADRRAIEDQINGRAAGADGYVLKPVQLPVLEERLEESLKSK